MIFSHMISFCYTGGLDSNILNDILEKIKKILQFEIKKKIPS